MPSSAPPGLGRLSAISIGRIARAAPRAAEPRLLLLPVVIIVVVDYVVSASSSRRRRGSSRPYAPRGPPPRAPAAPCKRDDVLVLVHVGSRAAPWMCARATHTRGGTTGLYVVQERERGDNGALLISASARAYTLLLQSSGWPSPVSEGVTTPPTPWVVRACASARALLCDTCARV